MALSSNGRICDSQSQDGSSILLSATKTCRYCGSPSKNQFCSYLCKKRQRSIDLRREFKCACGKVFISRGTHFSSEPRCRSCGTAANNVTRTGARNPAWKGGHRYYSPGRHGRDDQGLSWKEQRKLAWERDGYTCQKCGRCRTVKNPLWRPDVHHIFPWRVSRTHCLVNLICLCRKCHKQVDRQFDVLYTDAAFV